MTPLDAALRVSIVLGAALGLAALARRRPAALRHWILAAGIVCAAAAPALGPLAPSWRMPSRGAPSAAPPDTPGGAANGRPSIDFVVTRAGAAPSVGRRATLPGLAALALGAWIAGAGLALSGLIIGLGRLMWIGRRAKPLSDPVWQAARDDIARQLGLSRQAALLESPHPLLVTWGVLTPKIIVPPGASAWPRERIRIALAHELAHVSRRDWAIQMVAEVLRAAHWFNPVAWLACRRLRVESEHACDDVVLRLGVEGPEYASHLLELARSMNTRRQAWVPAQAIVRPSNLERRITAMLNTRLDRSPLTRAGRVAAAAALAAVTTLAAGYSSAQGLTTLTGTVTDQVGGVMPNIPIVLLDLTTNAKHEAQTNQLGRYELAGLPSGDYMMSIDKVPGFSSLRQRVVLAAATVKRDVRLQIGTIQESVTVTDVPPSLPGQGPGREQMQQWARQRATNGCDTPGGCIAPPIKTGDKKPVYPSTYTGAGAVVTLKGVIDTTGHVSKLRVVGQADPELAQAAITAVNQWEFEPTRLDGIVVETDLSVSVNFKRIER